MAGADLALPIRALRANRGPIRLIAHPIRAVRAIRNPVTPIRAIGGQLRSASEEPARAGTAWSVRASFAQPALGRMSQHRSASAESA